jgi:hypothetical protein
MRAEGERDVVEQHVLHALHGAATGQAVQDLAQARRRLAAQDDGDRRG